MTSQFDRFIHSFLGEASEGVDKDTLGAFYIATDRRYGILGDETPEGVRFKLEINGDSVKITTIETLGGKGMGIGSRVLKKLIDKADELGIPLTLNPSPYGDDDRRLEEEDLEAWYVKYGFVNQGPINGETIMRREPVTKRGMELL